MPRAESSTGEGGWTTSMVRRRLLGLSNLWILVSLTLLAVASWEVEAFETFPRRNIRGHAQFHVAPGSGRIHDSFGRERIFHGLNVVMKGAPWHPRIDAFDPQSSFTDEDIALLQEWGMNVVRLGIMWPGVEPRRDHVNSTYVAIMQSIVSKLHSAGVFTLLEFHQDLYTSQFCGEGLPSWIFDDLNQHHVLLGSSSSSQETSEIEQSTVSTEEEDVQTNSVPSSRGIPSNRMEQSKLKLSKMRYPASFPEPLGKRWPWPSEWDQSDREPFAERCNEHTWWRYYFSYAVSKAFQDLYDNKYGWGDLLARYWSVVAGAFKNQPGVLGYELMNEPWAGNIFSNPLLLLPGVADAKNLAHFYEKLQDAVRSVDSEKLLFFETVTFDNFWCGLSTVPGGEQWKNKTVMSYHYYTPPNFSADLAFAERLRESKRLGCGSMLTEFFVSTETDITERKTELRNLRNDMLSNYFAAGANDVNQRPRVNAETLSSDDTLESSCTVTRAIDSGANLNGAGLQERGPDIIKAHHRSRESLGLKPSKTSREKGNPQSKGRRVLKGIAKGAEKGQQRCVYEKPQRALMRAEKRDLERKEKVDSVNVVLAAADNHVQSWIAWEYKAFLIKTGSIVEQSLFNEHGELNLHLAKKLARTYPQAVCGNINSFSFNPTSSLFSLTYVAGAECRDGLKVADTEIFIHRQFYYPNGLSVKLSHSCASVSETERIILVKHTIDCFGLVIDLRISRLDPSAT